MRHATRGFTHTHSRSPLLQQQLVWRLQADGHGRFLVHRMHAKRVGLIAWG